MPKTEFGTLTKTETIVLWEQWISPVRPINYLRTVSILICRFMRMQTNAPGSERMKMMAILVLVSVFSACVFFLSLSLGFFLCFCFFFFFYFVASGSGDQGTKAMDTASLCSFLCCRVSRSSVPLLLGFSFSCSPAFCFCSPLSVLFFFCVSPLVFVPCYLFVLLSRKKPRFPLFFFSASLFFSSVCPSPPFFVFFPLWLVAFLAFIRPENAMRSKLGNGMHHGGEG